LLAMLESAPRPLAPDSSLRLQPPRSSLGLVTEAFPGRYRREGPMIRPEHLPENAIKEAITEWRPGDPIVVSEIAEACRYMPKDPHPDEEWRANFVVVVRDGEYQLRFAPKYWPAQTIEAGVKHIQLADGNGAAFAGELRADYDEAGRLVRLYFNWSSGEYGRTIARYRTTERRGEIRRLLSQATGLDEDNIVFEDSR